MNLIEDNFRGKKGNKKIFMACGISIIILMLIIIILTICAVVINSGMKLVIDNTKAKTSILWKDGDVYYIQIEALANNTKNGYSYKAGNPDMPDANGCYIVNQYESTVFKVNSNQIYKITDKEDNKQEISYYEMDNPTKVREIDNKIYMPLSAVKVAANANFIVTDKQITIESIGYIQSIYDREIKNSKNSNFIIDEQINWNVSYDNKKLLKDRIAIIKDNNNKALFGIATIKTEVTGKKKNQKTKVIHNEILSPRYKSIEYNEKFDQLIVETEDGKGIIQLVRDGSTVKFKTKVTPQYEDIKPITESLYLIAEKKYDEVVNATEKTDKEKNYVLKYGIINSAQEQILPSEYDEIGIENAELFTNNGIKNKFVILEKYIPVKKDKLWGIIDLDGNIVIKPTYDSLGCTETNASSNVLIIPELSAFVFKRNAKYGISYFDGKIEEKNVISRIYIDTINGDNNYIMIKGDKTYPLLKYIEDKKYMNSITNMTLEENNSLENTQSIEKTTEKNESNTLIIVSPTI